MQACNTRAKTDAVKIDLFSMATFPSERGASLKADALR
jgi:hypothetical protein